MLPAPLGRLSETSKKKLEPQNYGDTKSRISVGYNHKRVPEPSPGAGTCEASHACSCEGAPSRRGVPRSVVNRHYPREPAAVLRVADRVGRAPWAKHASGMTRVTSSPHTTNTRRIQLSQRCTVLQSSTHALEKLWQTTINAPSSSSRSSLPIGAMNTIMVGA